MEFSRIFHSYLLVLIAIFAPSIAYSQGDFGDIINHIEEYGVEENTVESESGYDFEALKKLSPKLAFTSSFNDFGKYQNVSFEDQEIKKLVDQFIKNELIETFDESFLIIQEECMLLGFEENKETELQNCEIILGHYEVFNEQLNTALDDIEVDKSIQDTGYGGSVEDMLDISLDGDQVTYATTAADDPHHELKVEADTTPNKNSVLLRGHVIIRDRNKKLTLADAICQFEKRQELNLSQQLVDEVLLYLEDGLIDQETSLKEKQDIFCTLLTYYEEIGDFDKLIEFLYLNMPEGDNFCDNNH